MAKNKKHLVKRDVKLEESTKKENQTQIHFGNAELVKIRIMEANNKLLFEILTLLKKVIDKIEKGE